MASFSLDKLRLHWNSIKCLIPQKRHKLFLGVIYVFILSKLQGWCSTKENDRLMAIVFKKKTACDLFSHCWNINTQYPCTEFISVVKDPVNGDCRMQIKGSFHQQITDCYS